MPGALYLCIPNWIVMVIVICLANMLEMSTTESALQIDFDYNKEMKVGGVACLVNAALLGSSAALEPGSVISFIACVALCNGCTAVHHPRPQARPPTG
jgi:hypothetical protein